MRCVPARWQHDKACQATWCNMFTVNGLAIKIRGYIAASVFSCRKEETSTPPIRHPRSGQIAPRRKKNAISVQFLGLPAVSKCALIEGPFMAPPLLQTYSKAPKIEPFHGPFLRPWNVPKKWIPAHFFANAGLLFFKAGGSWDCGCLIGGVLEWLLLLDRFRLH